MIVWDEPDAKGRPVRRRMLEGEAISWQRAAAGQRYHYRDEREALADFVATHWAWVESEGSRYGRD